MNPDTQDDVQSEELFDDNVLIPLFTELYVGMQAQGIDIPENVKGLLLQMFAAGAVAATHLLANGAEYADGNTFGVSIVDIEEAAEEFIGGDLGEDEEEDDSNAYDEQGGVKFYQNDDIQ